MKLTHFKEKYSPCPEAYEWAIDSGYTTFEQAWENCPRGDWLLWTAKKLGVSLKPLTKAKVFRHLYAPTYAICREVLTEEVMKIINQQNDE